MPTYLTPGIYIEEIPSGPKPIEAVGTSTAAFIGTAPNPNARLQEAFAVNNWSQFAKEYIAEGSQSTFLAQAVYGFFLNGGTRCYIVNVGPGLELIGDGKNRKGVELLEEVDEVAIVVAPALTDPASHDAILTHCEKMKDRVCILDPPLDIPNIDMLKTVGTPGPAPKSKKSATGETEPSPPPRGARPRNSNYGAFYAPWIQVSNPFAPKELIFVPPSGHVAGIYARTDATRGVHKAPANETVRGALDLSYKVTRDEQGELNRLGINIIRFFATQGIRVWGARMLAETPEWRYVNVRRLFNQIEESIEEGTNWVVFEPNDMSLWKAIRRDVGAFLTLQWRQGALMGATPEEAFFVKCDEETNPPEVIDAGMVVVVIGIAPVKPAEFVIFRIGQQAGGAEVEIQGGA